ncbi:MAG: PIN domain-containing protein [Planctomycetota bacterium]|jgi:predicted nucleic acid-binding protein
MYLVDTNIWLERLLDQARSAEVGRFLAEIPTDQLLMSDFTLHSIGILVDDVFVRGRVTLFTVQPVAMHRVVTAMDRFNLDFDDAYQYVAAELSDAEIVSFDGDFDRTARGRQTPLDVLSAEGVPDV